MAPSIDTGSSYVLSRLVDLAIGTPEVGSVNFNALHTLLHEMLRRLGLTDMKVQVDFDTDIAISKGGALWSPRQDDNENEKELTTSPMHALHDRLRTVERQMAGLNSLPNSGQLLEQMLSDKRPDDDQRAVSDLWQTVQLRRHVDANTEGIDRLSALVDELMKELRRLKEGQEGLEKQMAEMTALMEGLKDVSSLNKDLDDLKTSTANVEDAIAGLARADQLKDMVTWSELGAGLMSRESELAASKEPINEQLASEFVGDKSDDGQAESAFSSEDEELQHRLDGRWKEMEGTNQDTVTSNNAASDSSTRGNSGSSSSSGRKSKSTAASETLNRAMSLDPEAIRESVKSKLGEVGILPERHENLVKRVSDLEEKFDELDFSKYDDLIDKVADILKCLDELKDLIDQKSDQSDDDDLEGIRDLLKKLQNELDALNAVVDDLVSGHKDLCERMQRFDDRLLDLDKRKADLDSVDDLSSKKADKRDVDGKVNFMALKDAVDKLNKLIGDAFGKIAALEGELRHEMGALGELGPMGTDRRDGADLADLNNLRVDMDNRMRDLASRVRELMLREVTDEEAAGMRKKLASHFHCISCDRPLEILQQHPFPSQPDRMPARLSRQPHCLNEAVARRSPYPVFRPHSSRNSVGDIVDPYHMTRSAGGNHTVKMTPTPRSATYNSSDDESNVPNSPSPSRIEREELDILGVDGHIYKGRNERIIYSSFPVPGLPPVDEQERPRSAGNKVNSQRGSIRYSKARPNSSNAPKRENNDDVNTTTLAVPQPVAWEVRQ